jgi:hypothetical protein
MPDRTDELQRALLELGREVRRLEARVRRLEGAGEPAHERAGAAPAPPDTPGAADPATAVPQRTIALAGWTLLVVAGAYVARALTDARVVPAAAGVGLGLAYAVFWLAQADREAGRERRDSASFHAVAACLIAFPLLWEATSRFGLLGPRPAAAALAGVFGLGLAVSWRRGLAVVAYASTALGLAAAVALLVTTRDLLAGFAALLAIGAGVEWIASRQRWLPLRWWAAVALDAVALLLTAIVTRGLPDGYAAVSTGQAAGALLALPALYVPSVVVRTLLLGHLVTVFEVAQGTLAVVLGFGGAWRVLAAAGGPVVGIGALGIVLGALCYAAAFAHAERRAGQARNFYFYSSAGGSLVLAGGAIVAHGPSLALALGAAGIAAALLGRRFGRMTLRVHSGLFLAAGALESGLVLGSARALAGHAGDGLSAVACAIAAAAALGWAVLATDAGAPGSGWRRVPQLVLALLVVIAVVGAVPLALAVAFGSGLAADPAVAAVVRTATLAGLALGLAVLARRGTWPELAWLVYALAALGGAKLLVQDLRVGRPATLVASLALYGTVLVLAPRLTRGAASRKA